MSRNSSGTRHSIGDRHIGDRGSYAMNVSTDDLWGIFYVMKGPSVAWKSYYDTIEALRPLLDEKAFSKAVTGFYLNVVPERSFDSVRISYFTSDAPSANHVFKDFFKDHEIDEVQASSPPRQIVLATNYGGPQLEKRYRNFLNLATHIGLDLIKTDLLQARCLLATYRWQVRKAGLPVRAHFEPTFRRDSPTYNTLDDPEKDQLFRDLQEWPDPSQVDWAHFMVNLIQGCDADGVIKDPQHFITDGRPLSIPEINVIVKGQGFQIPSGWKP